MAERALDDTDLERITRELRDELYHLRAITRELRNRSVSLARSYDESLKRTEARIAELEAGKTTTTPREGSGHGTKRNRNEEREEARAGQR